MKIAQIAPLSERVPPKLYGGTERIVAYLTDELVRRGHEVTLFASGDSLTNAELVPCCERALRLDAAVRDTTPYQVLQLEAVRTRAHAFDVLHFHIDYLHFPLIRPYHERTLTTLHGRLDLPGLEPLYRAFPELPLVSISNAQRAPMPPVNWTGTIHHGLPPELFPYSGEATGGYLAFLGRIAPEKRPDLAIEIAARTCMPLKIAAKVDEADRAYWEEVIRPMVAAYPGADYIGEIGEDEKPRFLGGAHALLFPIDWPEPFGLVMTEAMACGTPVIAFRRGSVPEIVEDGVSGFIVDDVDEAVRAVARLGELSRAATRQCFERRFTVARMAEDYVAVYRRLAASARRPVRQAPDDLLPEYATLA